jgi:ribosomal protein L12E/L44/L45/RPP1/RPP2
MGNGKDLLEMVCQGYVTSKEEEALNAATREERRAAKAASKESDEESEEDSEDEDDENHNFGGCDCQRSYLYSWIMV